MKITRIGLGVADLESQAAWYEANFGLTRTKTFALEPYALTSEILTSPDGWELELLRREGAVPGIRATHPLDTALTLGYGFVAVEVEDLEAAAPALVEAGARELMGAHPGPAGWSAFLADPEGNLLQLVAKPGTMPDVPPPGPPPGGHAGPPPGSRP